MVHNGLVLAVAYLHVLLTSGVVFGWAALEVFYMDLTENFRGILFTAAASLNYLSNLFFGPFLDACGCRPCSLVACILMILGALLMVAAEIPAWQASRPWLVAGGFSLLGFAGPGVQMPTLRCELLFPAHSALVTSTNAALFDASCIVFLIFNLLGKAGTSAFTLFVVYALSLAGLLVSGQIFFGKLDSAATAIPQVSSSTSLGRSLSRPALSAALLSDAESRTTNPAKEPVLAASRAGESPGGFWGAVRSWRFLYLITFCSIGILRLNFVVMTINTQLRASFDAGAAGSLSTVFSSLLPWGGLAAPLTAYILGNYRHGAYRINLGLSIIYGLCLAFPIVPSQIVAYVIISVSRQFTYTIVFALTLSLFGQENLGKLLALNNVAVFVVGLLQYPIAAAVGGPLLPSWTAANMFMVTIALPLLLSNGGL